MDADKPVSRFADWTVGNVKITPPWYTIEKRGEAWVVLAHNEGGPALVVLDFGTEEAARGWVAEHTLREPPVDADKQVRRFTDWSAETLKVVPPYTVVQRFDRWVVISEGEVVVDFATEDEAQQWVAAHTK